MPWRRIGRLIYGAAALLLMLFSLQVLFFRTPIFIKLFDWSFDNQVRLNYSSAWSYWPGSVHARNFELTGEDDNVQWRLTIDKVQLNISLLSVFKKEFHATHVNAEGVTWALRSKQLLLDITPESLYGNPSIPGFDGMALKPYGPDEPDTDANYRLWTIHLDDVRAHDVREVWIEKAHLTGNAELSGGMFLRPMRQLRVMAQVQPKPLALMIGDDTVANYLYGRISVTVEPADLRSDTSMLTYVDASTTLDGMIGNLDFLKHMLPKEMHISAVPGPLKLNAVVEQGKLKSSSEIDISTPKLHFAKSPFRADSAVRVSLHSSKTQESRPQADAALELQGLSVALDKSTAAPLTAKRIRAVVRTLQLDLSKTLAVNSAAADIEELRLPELRLLEVLLPPDSKLKIEGGSAELNGHLDSSDENAVGAVVLGVHTARLHAAEVQLRADAAMTLSVHGKNPREGPMDLSGSHLEIDRASVTGAGGDEWWGHFAFPKASLDLNEKNVSLDLNAHCLDSRPLRALFAVEGVPGFVATFFTMKGLEATGSLHAGPSLMRLTDLNVHGKGASIRANYLSEGEKKKGEALIKVGVLTAGLDLDDGKHHVVLAGASSWFDERTKKADVAKATGTVPKR